MALTNRQRPPRKARLKASVRELPLQDLEKVVGGQRDPKFNPTFQMSPNGFENLSAQALMNLNAVFLINNPENPGDR